MFKFIIVELKEKWYSIKLNHRFKKTKFTFAFIFYNSQASFITVLIYINWSDFNAYHTLVLLRLNEYNFQSRVAGFSFKGGARVAMFILIH